MQHKSRCSEPRRLQQPILVTTAGIGIAILATYKASSMVMTIAVVFTLVVIVALASTRSDLLAGLLLITIPLVHHSSVVWGQILVRGANVEGVESGLMTSALAATAATLVLAITLGHKLKLTSVYESAIELFRRFPFYWVYLLLSVTGLVVGLVRGNSLHYIMSDTYNFLQPVASLVLSYVIARDVLGSRLSEGFIKLMLFVFSSGILVNFAFSVFWYHRLSSASGTPVLALGSLYFMARAGAGPTRERLTNWFFYLVFAIPVVASLKRAVWVALAIAVVVPWMQDLKHLRITRIQALAALTITLCIILGVGVTARAAPLFGQNIYLSQVVGRFGRLNSSEFAYRFVEAGAAIATLKTSIVNWAVGLGSGATFAVFFPTRVDPQLHNIHFTPAAVLFRYGLIGLVAYYGSLVSSLRSLSRLRRSSWLLRLAYYYLILQIVSSFSAYTLTSDVILPSIVGVGLANLLHDRSQARTKGALPGEE